MDDHSRKQIDELADLYLTGVIDQGDGDAADPLEGPEPIRLSPKIDSGDASSPGDSMESMTDQLDLTETDDPQPMLRLTENDEESNALEDQPASPVATATIDGEEQTPGQAPTAMLEAVLLGNLPGMSGPWLTQYAQLIAQTDGPVAVLHVGDSAIDLELVEPRAEAEPAPVRQTPAVRIPPMRDGKTGLVGLLDALTRSESSPTRTVLVRMDTDDQAMSLSRLGGIDDWTLLCGSDDASVAGAAQQLRGLIHAEPRLADRHVGLMVMGSDEDTARTAAERIASDTEHELVNRVEFIGHLKRMQPVHVREIGTFPNPVGVWPQLVDWFDSLEPPQPLVETAVPQPQQMTTTPETRADPQPQQEPVKPQKLSPAAAKIAKPAAPASAPAPRPMFTPPRPAARTAPQRSSTTRRPAGTTPSRTESAPTPAPQPAEAPSRPAEAPKAQAPQPEARPSVASAGEPTRQAPQPRVLTPQPELDLVALIGQGAGALTDPVMLDARIPDQPNTQLAVDSDGVVHVLMRDDEEALSDTRQAVMQLIEAGRWTREHLELIALTQRDHDFVDQAPTLHLLTGRADQATRLVGRLAGEVKLHLLQQVKLGKASGWFCTPLG